MIYPKRPRKKRRQRHTKSIFIQAPGTCYLCEMEGDYSQKYTELHHIFDGPNRKISEANGLTVRLCLKHHREGKEAVHNNAEKMRLLQRTAQTKFEESHSRQEFMRLIGRNYLE